MNVWTSQTVIFDLGWTLVHFVWEGLAIAALLAVVLQMLKSSTAQTRYLAGCTALMLMAIASLVTLAVAAHQNRPLVIPNAHAGPGWTETTTGSAAIPGLVPVAMPEPPAASFSRELETLFPWLVLGWVFGVCGLSCRLFAGWLRVRRLRSESAEPLPWTDPFAALARRLGVNRAVRLVQSALVEVPTVIGWLRPVILLPASCVTGLSSRELESIIAHELAHIRRHDYLVNLLQSALETLLFYHPVVWWVSERVREERELCCDDLAVAVCGDRVGYARALATLEELRPASAQLALAAGGAPLLQRIRRLAGKPERSAGRASWPVAGIALLLVVGILAAGMREHHAIAQDVGQAPPAPIPAAPPAPHHVGTNPPEVNIKAKFVEITKAPGDTNAVFSFDMPGGPGQEASVTGLLTEPQLKATMNALEKKDGVKVLGKPQAVTLSGRQVQMQIGETDPIVLPSKGTNASITNKFFGTTLDIIATVSADRKMISMTLTPSISTFLGYEEMRTNSTVYSMPHFELRQTTANVTTWDGNTVIIGGLSTDSTNAGSKGVQKELLVFVTATLINPDGTLYHSDEERKALWATRPPGQGSTN